MQVDSRTVAPDAVIQADVCIIGAGPAGITLARQFIGTNFACSCWRAGVLTATRTSRTSVQAQ